MKCLVCRYLKKSGFGRLHFSESCLNDSNLLSMKKISSAKFPCCTALGILDQIKTVEKDGSIELGSKEKILANQTVFSSERTLRVPNNQIINCFPRRQRE